MPTTGGVSSGFERYGAGNPLIRRVHESLVGQMGSSYDQTWPPKTPFSVEMFALAKAIALDGYGANQRLANNFIPEKAQLFTGMLQRWEHIFNAPPLPADTQVDRQKRVQACWLRFVQNATDQPVVDALKALLGPLYVGLVKQTIATELAIVGGIGNIVAAGTAPPAITLDGTPTIAAIIDVECTTGGPRGTALFKWSIDDGRTFVQTGQTTVASFPLLLGGVPLGVALHFPAETYATNNVWRALLVPGIPWMSTIMHLDVQVTQDVPGYHNADGSPNARFYATVAAVFPLLDEMLPAYTTFDWFIPSSHADAAFYLDEPNLDLEVLS